MKRRSFFGMFAALLAPSIPASNPVKTVAEPKRLIMTNEMIGDALLVLHPKKLSVKIRLPPQLEGGFVVPRRFMDEIQSRIDSEIIRKVAK